MKNIIKIIKETHEADKTYFVDFFMVLSMLAIGTVVFVWAVLNLC